VRNLALRAAEAAKNTTSLIEGTVKKVKEGSELLEITEKEFREVAVSVEKSSELVSEISAASLEQAQGIELVNKAVSEMEKVVQQNAANAEGTASASEKMNAQASEMKGFVAELKSLVEGSKGDGAAKRNEATGKNVSKKKHATVSVKIIADPEKKISGGALRGNKKDPNRSPIGASRPEEFIPFDEGELSDF
jgi:methyl-accepting chemotaxis protein